MNESFLQLQERNDQAENKIKLSNANLRQTLLAGLSVPILNAVYREIFQWLATTIMFDCSAQILLSWHRKSVSTKDLSSDFEYDDEINCTIQLENKSKDH